MSDGSGSDHAPRVHRASGRASSIDHGIAAHVGQSLRASAMSAVSAISEKIEVGTVFGTALNTMCNVIGAGVLSLPLAFYRASLGFAVVLTLIMSVVGIFSAYVLFVGCDRTGAFFMNECFAIALIGKRRPIRTDLDAVGGQGNDFIDENNEAEIAAEKKKEFYRTVLSMMVDGCILVNNYLCLAVYCGIILDSIPSVLRQFVHADGIWVEKITWVVIAGVVFFALTSVRNMDELKWTSLLGVATILWAIFAVFLQYCMHGYQGPDVPGDRPEIIYFEVKSSFAAAFDTLALAYGYHYNIPIFYHELQDRSPRKMMKSVAIAFPVITISYVLTGVIGYLSFAQHVDDNDAHGVIINNYGTYNTVINTVRLGLFFHFACVYPVLGVCVRHSLHRFILTFMGRRKEALDKNMPALVPRWAIVSEAFLLVSTSSALAYLYPNVGQLINIVGDLCSSHLMVTIPGIIGMCIWAPRDYGKALLDEDHSRLDSVSQDGSDVADYPPPLWNHRKLMYGLCTGLTVFGLVLTIISFYSTLM